MRQSNDSTIYRLRAELDDKACNRGAADVLALGNERERGSAPVHGGERSIVALPAIWPAGPER